MTEEIVGNIFVNEDGTPLVLEKSDEREHGFIGDEEWIRSAFVLPDGPNVDPDDLENRYWYSASSKFTDGRFGCNIGINCHPQITAYADPPEDGRGYSYAQASITENTGVYGMGGMWSEAFDTPEQVVYLRFGVPSFNSPLNFFLSAYNYGASVVARTGRWPSFIYDITRFAGSYLTLRAFPLITVPLLLYKTADFFFGRQSAKYYHMKPTMHLYWGAVTNLMNTMAINSGIYPKIMNANQDDTQRIGMPFKMDDQDTLDVYHELAPDLFTKENFIDAYALATRAQRLANEMIYQEYEANDNGSTTDWGGYVKKYLTGDLTHSTRTADKNGNVSFMKMVEQYLDLGDHYDQKEKKADGNELDPRGEAQKTESGEVDSAKPYNPLYSDSSWNNFKKHLTAEFRQGGSFAVFRVCDTGSKSESFSSSTTTSSLENKINSISSNFQEHRFTFGGLGAVLPEMVSGAVNLATDAMMGAIDGVTFGLASNIKGMMGEGYVEIPEHWQSSSSSLPSAQYKIQLDAWNGSTFTRLFKLFLPFCMLAAGAWPRSTGRQSYTGPFLCQIYDRGRVQIPLGMITEFGVTRGDGNLGFTTDGSPLSMTLSFTVKDLSRVLHMPLVSGNLTNEPTMIDEDSTITNYLATVAGQSFYNQIYPSNRAKIRAAKAAMNIGRMTSPAFWASYVHDTTTAGIGSWLTLRTGLLIEGLSRNAETTMGPNPV